MSDADTSRVATARHRFLELLTIGLLAIAFIASLRTPRRSTDDAGAILTARDSPASLPSHVLRVLGGQASTHWTEFGLIVVSGNVALALGAAYFLITRPYPESVHWLSAMMTISSLLAVLLAYYSIQVAAILVVTPLRLADLLASFVIALAQIALFTLINVVLSDDTLTTPRQYFDQLRHWPAIFGTFALAAWFASSVHFRARRSLRLGRSPVLKEFERAQRFDRVSAFVTATLQLGLWWSTFVVGDEDATFLALILALIIATAATILALVNQSRTVRRTWDLAQQAAAARTSPQ